ncbi:MAG: hypothetical protein AAFR59_01005 [Bacteroidota bacterium]
MQNKSQAFLVGVIILGILGMMGCEEYIPYARKYGYPRIDTPAPSKRVYQTFDLTNCPVRFDYPSIGEVARTMPDSCWVDVKMTPFNLTWHITYRKIPSGSDIDRQREDHRKLVYKHSQKATRIQEILIEEPQTKGILYEVYGEVGTPVQAFLYDSTQTQVALLNIYFQTAEGMDSLAPVIQYMKEELNHTLETFRWEKS